MFAELEIHVIIEKCEDNLRILIFNMPSRQKSMTVKSDGIVYMGNGGSIVRMGGYSAS
ncbi:hypothetical protein [Candidatus Endomicrobiellum agilis]|uniref:hypothetical protein n=1 Tax=Candidatus Endomicrobiellum agilis TaxID=3238957 RepID=UPI0035754546|nr:hypothetical protein [Endomicrobium sp.]